MSLSRPANFPRTSSSSCSITAGAVMLGSNVEKKINGTSISLDGTKERIRKMFDKVELSVSSYDTAWVAMVPSPTSPRSPFFPQCVHWLLENQLCDGSWASAHDHPLLMKDTLLSTLACVLSLKRWGVGEQQINKGIQFIKSNFHSVSDDKQYSPIGFDIIFPSLFEHAESLGLNLSLGATSREAMVKRRELLLKGGSERNSEGWRTYIAYISEGMGHWEGVTKYQRKNGSLFNSPATTAAAFTNLKNDGCLNYLLSLIEKYGSAVPAVYPLDIYARLCMVDTLEQLGVSRHFIKEIKSVLDETHRYWLQGEEDIFLDPATCAMAFRMLRINGYHVSSDPLTQYSEDKFSSSLQGYLNDFSAILELYKASQIIMHPDELVLEKQNSWTRHLLENQSLYHTREHADNEILVALKFPYHASLERISHRRAIENYNADSYRILKTSYSSVNLENEEFLKLAVEDFNICQSIHREELVQLAQWVKESGLDKLKFARQKLAYCYFSAAATLFAPELSDARVSWAKNGVLTTVVDDFFDVGGSEEEHTNLIELVEKWDVDVRTDCCSESVKIIFSAIKNTVSEIGERAWIRQGRSVTSNVIKIWLDLMRSMLNEAKWCSTKFVPSIDEYMENAYTSFALGPIVLPALYLVGPVLTQESVESPEFSSLFELMSTCGRLLNDMHSYKRESVEGKLNVLALRIIHSNGVVTEKDATDEIKCIINHKRRELLRLVLHDNSSSVPRACRDLFWKMIKVLHMFYMKDDGFTSHDMINTVNAVIEEPITLY